MLEEQIHRWRRNVKVRWWKHTHRWQRCQQQNGHEGEPGAGGTYHTYPRPHRPRTYHRHILHRQLVSRVIPAMAPHDASMLGIRSAAAPRPIGTSHG